MSAPRAIPQDIPFLPSSAANTSHGPSPLASPPHQRGHSRSISHPFNHNLFSGITKRRNQSISTKDFLDSDDDDEVTFTPVPLSSSPRKPLPRPPPGGEELITGRCMTCSTTVRWPNNLKTFRCTECLMVNDLEPYKESGDAGPGKDGKPAVPRKALPLSIDRTKGIIDNCVSSYLRRILEPETRAPPIGNLNGKPLFDRRQSPSRDPGPTRPRGLTSNVPVKPKDGTHGSSYPTSYLSPLSSHGDSQPRGRSNSDVQSASKPGRSRDAKDHTSRPSIFKPLEDYIITSFKGCDCLNASFITLPPQPPSRPAGESGPAKPVPESSTVPNPQTQASFEPDAKTLLLGDLAENSSWWMHDGARANGYGAPSKEKSSSLYRLVSSRTPRINWAEVSQWYHLIMTAGTSWVEQWSAMQPTATDEDDAVRKKRWESMDLVFVEREVSEARYHLQRALLKTTENLLKRPRRPLKKAEETRVLLILLANPLLHSSTSPSGPTSTSYRDERRPSSSKDPQRLGPPDPKQSSRKDPSRHRSQGPGQHSGIVKRILGLMANLPNDCHHYLVSWFSRFSAGQFEKLVELIGSFVTYRLTRQHGRKRSESVKNDNNSLIPSFSSPNGNTPAELHAAINGRNQNKSGNDKKDQPMLYGDDWQIRVAARIMSLLFTANHTHRRPENQDADSASKNQPSRRGHIIPISSFYNTLLDYSDLVADFEAWETKMSKFSFCQYPFFLSIWAKIHIMEYDARRQMEVKAREAFFNSILSRKAVSQFLVLKVRRDCLVEDSLRSVSEVVWSAQEEVKKGLRIEFIGEEGVDAGGLRKEWFLLLVREVFDPNHGLFIYDEDSKYCYFNPCCFESSEQFFLVGVLLGLAIYNSTILDVPLPPFAFKRLLAGAPQPSGTNPPPTSTPSRSSYKCTLDDLAEYRPALARGLRSLLDFEGDVAETFCRDFVAQVDRYGEAVEVPLCPGGEKRPVTNANRREFVDLYVQYLLDTAVTRQFQPFRRGFFTVCGGNALSLFRPEEIELLVRGSEEPLDVTSLRAVATYDNWPAKQPELEPVVQWFWEFFEQTQPSAQRKLLSFITGSDRIPAMGATSLNIRLACLGEDSPRYPVARTCFNMLGLYRYPTREKLERMLWEAVIYSEGFGLK
ncbi:HECT-type E3 ubiquitin-protein ligase [Aspergillus glaucus CBS 516.65]|uniref:HECT-type E3 ubiquitin transferase n=1 Tax=Aspergillus glaucus CBS 516.65 TaxID=1160497 RepID=A0A1L9VRG6_ASPGL|nr:hypothetical protein ASPGLDRAFT_121462 [Aspergillus glaucus CBS 516.65]OJJ86528.1 hypothetical protein ASPGLDRAFT_121462 [Aspergillus glaucus CBS 516.65]